MTGANFYVDNAGCARYRTHQIFGLAAESPAGGGGTGQRTGDDPATVLPDPYQDLLRNSVRYVRSKYLGNKPVYYLFTSRGCVGSCSYCAARLTFGPVTSKPLAAVVQDMHAAIEAGHRNFMILGDDVGAFGIDRGGTFPDLLAKLLTEVERPRSGTASNASRTIRLYIDEFHPRWMLAYLKELTELIAHRSIVTLLCPLQSGSDRILRLMNRAADAASVVSAVKVLHLRNPRLRIDTKMMVGFPSETEDEFRESLELLSGLPLSTVIIVPYEEREGTAACAIGPKVAPEVIRERVARAQRAFRQRGVRSVLMPQE